MRGFNDSWLHDYEAKRMAYVILPDRIDFVLPAPTLSLNRLLRMHWAARRHYAAELSADIARATTYLPPGSAPMLKARVTITRYGLREIDRDGLIGGVKPLVDCLLPRSSRHPHGLGLVADDSPTHMTLIVESVTVSKRSAQRTHVLIERID